jgi:hypothetical protein
VQAAAAAWHYEIAPSHDSQVTSTAGHGDGRGSASDKICDLGAGQAQAVTRGRDAGGGGARLGRGSHGAIIRGPDRNSTESSRLLGAAADRTVTITDGTVTRTASEAAAGALPGGDGGSSPRNPSPTL